MLRDSRSFSRTLETKRSEPLVGTLLLPLLLLRAGMGQIANIVVASGANFLPGVPGKGSRGTIFCTGLDVHGSIIAGDLPLPASLGGVTLLRPRPNYIVAAAERYEGGQQN